MSSAADDYQAAYVWLLPMFGQATAERLVAQLSEAPVVKRQAVDIVRSACLELIPKDNPQVQHFMGKFRRGKSAKPVLLVEWRPLVVADGHHRVAAAFYVDPAMLVDCQVA